MSTWKVCPHGDLFGKIIQLEIFLNTINFRFLTSRCMILLCEVWWSGKLKCQKRSCWNRYFIFTGFLTFILILPESPTFRVAVCASEVWRFKYKEKNRQTKVLNMKEFWLRVASPWSLEFYYRILIDVMLVICFHKIQYININFLFIRIFYVE